MRIKMEYEVRFYFSVSEKENIINKLNNIKNLKCSGTFYEKTTQYNSNDINNDFYSKNIDGRYRVRITKGKNETKCMLSWKKRLKDTKSGNVNKEEEIECRIDPRDYDNFIYLTENVVKMIRVESYERYRTNYDNEEIEVSVDLYPFGLALEIEAKCDQNQEDIVEKYVKELGLNLKDSYRLSWDDKYNELCDSQNIKKYSDVLFENKDMPNI